MPKRSDNIHKRKDGRWEGRYKKGRNENGKLMYGSVYGKTYRETKEKLMTKLYLSNTQTEIKKSILFEKILDLWMENNRSRLKGATIHKYQNMIDSHIKKELGSIHVSKLNSTIINIFIDQKLTSGRLDGAGGLSASYVRTMILIINAAYEFATKEQLCLPLKYPISKPNIPKTQISIFSIYEQKTLEEYIKTNPNPTNLGILLSLYMGLRIGEICALRWDNIDLENQMIKIRHTIARIKDVDNSSVSSCLILDTPKTKSSTREIPITSTILPYLQLANAKESKGFFLTGTETFMQPRTYEYRYRKVLKNCNISYLNYHALRHTFATRCIEVGVDVKSLSEILGHSNVSITLNTYVHSSFDMKRSQLEKVIHLHDSIFE